MQQEASRREAHSGGTTRAFGWQRWEQVIPPWTPMLDMVQGVGALGGAPGHTGVVIGCVGA